MEIKRRRILTSFMARPHMKELHRDGQTHPRRWSANMSHGWRACASESADDARTHFGSDTYAPDDLYAFTVTLIIYRILSTFSLRIYFEQDLELAADSCYTLIACSLKLELLSAPINDLFRNNLVWLSANSSNSGKSNRLLKIPLK